MAAPQQAATFRIEALDKASKVLNGVDKRLSRVGKSAARMGKQMSTALTLPLALIGAKAVTTFANFELSMAKVQAVSGATGDKFKALEKDALRLGAATKFSASEVAGLQLNYSKLGFKPDEILKVTEATLALAQATDEELGASAAIAGGTLRGFRLEASETTRVTDVMAKSFSSSALDLEKYGESMKYIAPIAAEANISLEETTAMVSVLANNMIDGSMAGTSMRVIINKLAASGKPLSKVLEDLGKKGVGLAEAESLVGARAQTALLILAKNTDKVKELTKEYKNAGGAAKAMAAIMDNTLSGAFARMGSSLESALITVGKAITPILAPALEKITKLLSKVGDANPAIVAVGVAIAGVVAAIGPVLIVVGLLISSIGSIAGVLGTIAAAGGLAAILGTFVTAAAPVLAVIAAVVAGVMLVVEAMGGWKATWEQIKLAGVALGQQLLPIWEQIKVAGVAAWDLISGAVSSVINRLQLVFKVLSVSLRPQIIVIGKIFGLVFKAIKANIWLVTKAIQAISVVLGLVELGVLTMAKAAISAFNKWADANQETLAGLVNFANGIIEAVESTVNAALSAVGGLILGALNKLSEAVTPFINGIISAMNDLTGTEFEPIELKVAGVEDLKVDLGRVSIEGVNEGRKNLETGIDSMLAGAKSRLGGSFGKLIGQDSGEQSDSGLVKADEAVKKVTDSTQNLGVIAPAALGKVGAATAAATSKTKELSDSQKILESQFDSITGNMTSALDDFVTTGKVNFKDLTRSIISDLAQIAIKAQATQLLGSLFGGSGGAGSGLGGVVGSLFSFDGGGFTGGGSRSGGVDGKGGFPAILHPNETVVDHTKGQGASGGNITIQQTVVIKETVPAAMANSIAEAGKNAALQAIQQIKQRGGRRAAAY